MKMCRPLTTIGRLSKACLVTLSFVLLVCLTGCADLNLRTPRLTFDEPEPEVPKRLIPVWTDTVLHTAGETPTRGFGGRIMFYGNNEDAPIAVDGTLIVYAWDDSDQRKASRSPDRKYVFPSDKMQKHHSISKVGDSYSFWLPWDAVGGPSRQVTLISRFVSKQGGEVTSTAANMVLPGDDQQLQVDSTDSTKASRDNQKSNDQESDIQLAAFETSANESATTNNQLNETGGTVGHSDRRMNSTTIDLPPAFLKRQIAAGAAPVEEKSTTPYEMSTGSVWEPAADHSTSKARSTRAGVFEASVGSERNQHQAQRTPAAKRLADRARMRRPLSAWRYGDSPTRESREPKVTAGHSTDQN